MKQRLAAVPWFVAAPTVAVLTATVAVFGYTFVGDLFVQTCANDVNLLTGAIESGCGSDGATPAPATGEEQGMEMVSAPGLSSPTGPVNQDTPPPAASTPAVTPTPAEAKGPGVLARGAFVDGAPGHFGSGVVEVQRLADGSLNLRLANLSVTSGPDLIVYLSPSPDDYVSGGLSLGALKANNGNQNYAIPAGSSLDGVRSVVIWCKSFPTVFAYATLEMN